MGIYGDFHPYKIMHFISHSLPLFQGGGRKTLFMQCTSFLQFSLLLSERLWLMGKITDLH